MSTHSSVNSTASTVNTTGIKPASDRLTALYDQVQVTLPEDFESEWYRFRVTSEERFANVRNSLAAFLVSMASAPLSRVTVLPLALSVASVVALVHNLRQYMLIESRHEEDERSGKAYADARRKEIASCHRQGDRDKQELESFLQAIADYAVHEESQDPKVHELYEKLRNFKTINLAVEQLEMDFVKERGEWWGEQILRGEGEDKLRSLITARRPRSFLKR